jgi:hypothetical protein
MNARAVDADVRDVHVYVACFVAQIVQALDVRYYEIPRNMH